MGVRGNNFHIQLVHSDRERAHGHMTARDGVIREVDSGPAPIVDVPGHDARMFLVVVVRAHLAVDADNVQDAHGEAEEDSDDGGPYAHNEGNEFGEQDEEGEYRDSNIVVGQTGERDFLSVPNCLLSQRFFYTPRMTCLLF